MVCGGEGAVGPIGIGLWFGELFWGIPFGKILPRFTILEKDVLAQPLNQQKPTQYKKILPL